MAARGGHRPVDARARIWGERHGASGGGGNRVDGAARCGRPVRATGAPDAGVRRLSWPEDLAELLRLHREGLTQVAIAERLGCRQCTVSRWLARLDDTRDLARTYLRAQALRMAHNIVEKGKVADHIRVLQLLGVLLHNTGDGRLLVFIPGEAEPIWQGRALPGSAEAPDGNARAATSGDAVTVSSPPE